MEIAEHITAVEQEGKLLAAAAGEGGLDVQIPTCPGWDMRELLRHLSEIHLWAAGIVSQRTTKLWPDDISEHTETWPELAVFWPEDDDMIEMYLRTNTNLVSVLEAAPSDLECPTFLPAPSPRAMWARRQAHETAIHRFDAEYASGISSQFAPVFAADGVDELLAAFAPRGDEFPITETQLMHVHAVDTDDHWYTQIGPDGISTSREGDSADTTLSGAASDLYLVLWNRGEDSSIDVAGNGELLELWHDKNRIRWS